MQTVTSKILTAVNKRIFSYTAKIAMVLLAFWFIYKKVGGNEDLKNFRSLLARSQQTDTVLILSFVVLLMFVNWGLEVFKWRRLLSHIERISVWRSVESVFCGLTLAIFTPSRIGEYGGRVFFLSPKRRVVGIIAMAVGNIGQMVLTNIFGAIAICLFINRFVDIDYRIFYMLVVLSAAFCVFLVVFYFNIQWVKGILVSMRITRKYQKFYNILGRYKKAELLKILLFGLARYLVFSTQYFILLDWLIPCLHYPDVIMMLCILFFIQSSLPSLDIFDIGVRSLTATFFFGYITDNTPAVIATTACIWLINIILPALLGSWFVFKLNFFGNPQRS